MNRPSRHATSSLRRFAAFTAVSTTSIGVAASGALASPGEPVSPATGHSEVIAQTVWDFHAGAQYWTASEVHIEPETEDVVDSPGFVVTESGLLDADDHGRRTLIATGEAVFLEAGSSAAAGMTGDDYAFIALEEAGPDQGGAFDPGETTRDVDLVRDVLDVGETRTIADQELPIFLLVTDGVVDVADGEAGDLQYREGVSVALDGEVAISNTADDAANFVVIVTGPDLGDGATSSVAPPSSEPTTNSTEPTDESPTVSFSPTEVPPGGTVTITGSGCTPGTEVELSTWNADTGGQGVGVRITALDDGSYEGTVTIHPTLTPGTRLGVQVTCGRFDEPGVPAARDYGVVAGNPPGPTAPPTPGPTSPGDPDDDNDGLSNSDELLYNSSPTNWDTDGDGWSDGHEVHETRTEPDSQDTDGDSLNDPAELDHGTNPFEYDTDGDVFSDGHEVYRTGTDPNDSDSDDDGLDDSDEEIFSDPNDGDTDDDGLDDSDEFDNGTNPWSSDTDSDGFSDPAEIAAQTNPRDPGSHP